MARMRGVAGSGVTPIRRYKNKMPSAGDAAGQRQRQHVGAGGESHFGESIADAE